jgi:hypothetical protein
MVTTCEVTADPKMVPGIGFWVTELIPQASVAVIGSVATKSGMVLVQLAPFEMNWSPGHVKLG